MPESKHALVMHFIDESSSFCNGFEAGQMWERLKRKEIIEKECVHSENIEQYRLMAIKFNYEMQDEATEVKGWHYITLTPRLTTLTRVK